MWLRVLGHLIKAKVAAQKCILDLGLKGAMAPRVPRALEFSDQLAWSVQPRKP